MRETFIRKEQPMTHVLLEIEMPASLTEFKLPAGLNERLQNLLDKQDRGNRLTTSERLEAEGLVEMAEMLSLLRLKAQRIWSEQ